MALSWGGAQVTATDRDLDSARVGRLRENIARVAPDVKVVAKTDIAQDYDAVWVDAPCTGSGVLRKHPEIRWQREEKDLHALLEMQSTLLHEGAKALRSGGALIYSVCSVLSEEGRAQIERFAKGSPFRVEHEWSFAPQEAPHGDGFYGALLRLT